MDNRVHVLQVISGMGSGGAEMFLMNMYRNMDHDKIVFDFLLQSDENLYKEELEQFGSTIYQIAPYYKNYFKNVSQLKSVLRNHFPIVHVHANALLYITPLIYAKKEGVPCRIMHSHNSSLYYKWALPYHKLNRRRVQHYVTNRFACSEEAGKWMFDKDFKVIPNAVDLQRFSHDVTRRAQLRKELGISENTFLLGQIGRLFYVKNQQFSMEVLKRILSAIPDSILVFVGEGGAKAELEAYADKLQIRDRVIFLGVRTDIPALFSAFDAFIFPSLYEGLPVTMVEAQANGLPVFCSSAVPDQAVLAPNVHRLSLDLGPEQWAKEILSSTLNRTDNKSLLEAAGFSIRQQANALQAFYLKAATGEAQS